ncbi:protein kinase [Helicosporidium sp. ATCC 50920]|nr:protein kinase [Helicosporidium sp. ATCC 50920]|eukprot:KDD75335.1 protein kinase [Helicosporidium sp. ATCC 50920]
MPCVFYGQGNSPTPALSEPVVKLVAHRLFLALAHCHAAGIAHRDVSPSNVLLSARGAVALADFGQACALSSPAPARSLPPSDLSSTGTPGVGTRWYKSPETLLGSRTYAASSDIWAAGCVVAELLAGAPLFPGSCDIDQLCRLSAALGGLSEEVWPGIARLPDWGKLRFAKADRRPLTTLCPGLERASPEAVRLLEHILVLDPERRPTAPEVLASDFFTSGDSAATEAQVAALLTF